MLIFGGVNVVEYTIPTIPGSVMGNLLYNWLVQLPIRRPEICTENIPKHVQRVKCLRGF